MARQRLFTVTRTDCEWQYYRGSGKGGQNRNKRDTAVRCVHRLSGAEATACDERSQGQNKRLAWKRMCQSAKFSAWVKIECARRGGLKILTEEEIQAKIDAEFQQQLLVETKEDGYWVEGVDISEEETCKK